MLVFTASNYHEVFEYDDLKFYGKWSVQTRIDRPIHMRVHNAVTLVVSIKAPTPLLKGI